MVPRLPAPPEAPAPRRLAFADVLARPSGGFLSPAARLPESTPETGSQEDVLRRSQTAYQNKLATAQALGVEGEGTGPRGFLETVAGPLSVLDLPRSAVFSTLTGNPTGVGEHRGFGDLGPLRVQQDDGLLERSVKGALAFVGDVATDPLTYVSFGAGPLGKKVLTRVAAAQARQIASKLSDDVVRRWADDALRFRGTSRIRQMADEAGDDTLKGIAEAYEQAAAQPPATWRGTPDEWTRDLGERQFAGGAAEAYQQSGSVGLRRFLIGELGDEAGEAAFDALPLDLRGGPRVRVPFAKDETGLPLTLPMAGDDALQGGGRLTERLFGEAGVDRLEDIHRLRNQARSSRLGRLVADRFTGDENGRLYGQMVADLYRQGDDEGLDRVTWRAYEAVTEATEASSRTARRMRNEAAMLLGRVEQMFEGAGEDAGRARDLFVERFNDPAGSRRVAQSGGFTSATGEPIRFAPDADPDVASWYAGLDDAERRAVSAALDVHRYFEGQLAEMRNAGLEVNEVREYVARVMSDDERLLRERRKPVRRSQGKAGRESGTDQVASRQKYVAGDLEVDEAGELRLRLRWRTPEEINRLEGREVFVTDPTQIVARYADAVSRASARIQFANLVNEAGVTVPGGISLRRSVHEVRVGAAGRAIDEVADSVASDVQRARETLQEELSDAQAAEAAVTTRHREALDLAERSERLSATARRAGEAAGGNGLLDAPEDGWVRLWHSEDVDGVDDVLFYVDDVTAQAVADGGRVSYLDVPEPMAHASAVPGTDGAEFRLPQEVVNLRRPAPSGDVDPILSRPRGEVIDEAGEQAVSEAEAELRRVLAEERLAEFEARQAGRVGEDVRAERAAAAEFVFQAGGEFRPAVLGGVFSEDGTIRLPNMAELTPEQAAEMEGVAEGLHAAGYRLTDVAERTPTSLDEFYFATGGGETALLDDVWTPVDAAALDDMRRTFLDQVDVWLPEDWAGQAFERFGRRLLESSQGTLRPSMTARDVSAVVMGRHEGPASFADTGIPLHGTPEEVAVAVRFLELADQAGFDVRYSDFNSAILHHAINRTEHLPSVQLSTSQWAIFGGGTDAKRTLARWLSEDGVAEALPHSLSLRKMGRKQEELIASLDGVDLAEQRRVYDEWEAARRAAWEADPTVPGDVLMDEMQRRIDSGLVESSSGKAAYRDPNVRHQVDYDVWVSVQDNAGRPTRPETPVWPDTVEGLADLYGRLETAAVDESRRAADRRALSKLAEKVESALSDAGWRLEQTVGEAALPPAATASGIRYGTWDAADLYPLNGAKVKLEAAGSKVPDRVFTVSRTQEGGVKLTPDDGAAPIWFEPEDAELPSLLTAKVQGRWLNKMPTDAKIVPVEAAPGAAGETVWSVAREVDGDRGLPAVFSEGRTSAVDAGPEAPRPVDDVVLPDDEVRRVRNEARAEVRARYDDASARALAEGRLLPDDVEQSLNRNVVRKVDAADRRVVKQAEKLAKREGRSAARRRAVADADLEKATARTGRLEALEASIDSQMSKVATERSALLSRVKSILNDTPNVEQQQQAIDALMEGLTDWHGRVSDLHDDLIRATSDQMEKRLARARRAYSRRMVSTAESEAAAAVRSQPVIDLGGELLDDAGLQQIGQQKQAVGAPITQGLSTLPPELDVTWAPENLRLAVERHYQARLGDEDVQRWLNAAYRPWFALFKAWATVGRGPGYHVRNLMGAWHNNWIAGVTAADHSLAGVLVKARREATKQVADDAAERLASRLGIPLEDAHRRVTPEVFEAEIEQVLRERLSQVQVVDGLTLYDVHRLSVAQQVGDASRVLEGLSEALGEQSARAFVAGETRANLFRNKTRAELNRGERFVNRAVDNKWIRTSSDWGQLTEEYVRHAAFIQGLRRYGPADGGGSARLFSDGLHFDYQALTREERMVRSTLIPFYVWMRRNTPLQFRALAMSPGKYRQIIAANEAARHAFEDDEQDVVPEWMRETLGWGSVFQSGGNPIAIGVESPAIDLNRMVKMPDSLAPGDIAEALGASGRELLSAVSPAVKAPIEQALGVDSFTGAPFNQSGVPAPWWYRALPDLVAPTRTDEHGQVRGSDARISALQDALPFLGLADRALPLTPQQQERALTNYISLLAPVVRTSTLNPRQIAGELRSRTERLDEQIEWGPGSDTELLAMVTDLLEQGLTPDEVRERVLAGVS